MERGEEQQEDDEESARNPQRQALVGFLLQLELPAPIHEVPRGLFHLRVDRLLRRLDEGPDVPPAHVALDRDEPLVVLPGPLPRTDDFLDLRQVPERDLYTSAGGAQDPGDRFRAVAVFRFVPDQDVEPGDALEDLPGLLSSNGRADDVLDLSHVDPVAGDRLAIYGDPELRGSRHLVLLYVRRPRHGPDHRLDLRGLLLEDLPVGAEDLDRQVSLGAG